METNSQGPAAFFEKYGTALAVLVGALIIGAAFTFGRGGTATEQPVETVAPDIKEVAVDASPSIGPKNAPVTIAVWFDYQCHYCQIYETTTLPQVLATYGDKVRIVYKDFQFFGAASNDAALYSRAVWDAYPERWGEWFKGMFTNTEGKTLTVAEMDALSTRLGFDVPKLQKLRTDNVAKYQAAIDADYAEGMKFGIKGTPGTIIGTQFISGAQTFENVKPLLDAELAK